MGLDSDLRHMAAIQHGLISLMQARELGAGRAALRHRSGGSSWDLVTSRVLRLVGSPATVEQVLMAAALDGGRGTVVSHLAAAALWRLPAFEIGPVEVSRPRGCSGRPPPAGTLHQPRYLPPSHLTELRGIPVTTLPRTLFDVAGRVRPARVGRVIDSVVSRSPAILPVLHALLGEMGGSGRAGIGVMRQALHERPVGYVAPESGLEARFHRILTEAGERALARQVDVGGHEWVGRVDFADLAAGLLVEVDSATFHSGRLALEHDRLRDTALVRAGWRHVVRVTEDQIWRRPAEAVAAVRAARRALRAA